MKAREALEKFQVEFTESGDWAKVFCPFHPNKDTPAGILSLTSGRYECKGCGKVGDVFDFLAGLNRSTREAVMTLCDTPTSDRETAEKTIDVDVIERWHQGLLRNKRMQEILFEKKGITLETIQRWRLGVSGDRVTIPIRAFSEEVVNVRQWSPTDKERKVINVSGHGKARLFPLKAFEHDVIFVTEGEWKALMLWQRGHAAITGTGGAGTWMKKWSELFKGKIVFVVTDIDEKGRESALKICSSLAPHAKLIKNVQLPLSIQDYPTGGIDDFFIKAKLDIADLMKLVDETPVWEPTPLITKLQDDEHLYDCHLAESSHADRYNKFVKVECVVSAKDTHPFIIPKEYFVSCRRDQDICPACPIYRRPEDRPKVSLDQRDPVLLELINTRTAHQPEVLKRAARIPKQCQAVGFAVETTYNIEELRLIPQLKIASNTHEHVVRRAFFVGHGIETNTPYEIHARCIPEPQSQYATLLAYEAKSSTDSLSCFNVTDEMTTRLRNFSCEPTIGDIRDKVAAIYTDLEANVTRIYQRRDMHLVYDLTYHSALYVPFQGRVYKGWVESLIVGDSGQGKSETIKSLLAHYSLGEKVDAKNATLAGLIGGLQETAKRWFVSWGVITLNDRRLVALEEVKGMSTDVIARMTDARSSGIASVSMIEKASTTCRCRLTWISNPRSQRTLSTYNYGVEAIKELIGSLEDVRRFDIACIVASGDVPREVVNSRPNDNVTHTYTSDLCRDLLLWVWSRKADDVIFTDGAIESILDHAQKLAQRYSSQIPLVEAADQRLKLARLSAALAGRLFSTDNGHRLVVHRAHVDYLVEFLDKLYSSKTFGYLDYSTALKGEDTIENEDSVITAIKQVPFPEDLVKLMIDANVITAANIVDWGSVNYEEAKQLVGHLVRKRALKGYKGAYVKTPAFLGLLKRLRASGELKQEMPSHLRKDGELG